MANLELVLDKDTLDETLSVICEGIEWRNDKEIDDETYEAILEKAADIPWMKLSDYMAPWRAEYECLMEAWCQFTKAIVTCTADEILNN